MQPWGAPPLQSHRDQALPLETSPPPSEMALTCLVCGDVDRHKLPRRWTLAGHAVQGLDFKGVVGVSEQVRHHDGGVSQAALLWKVPDVAATRLALP